MTIDRPDFAQECVRQGVIFRIEPHYLLAVAQLRSGISEGSADGKVGAFRLTQAEWDANSNDDEFDVHFKPTHITNTTRQCIVFALMAHRAFDDFVSDNARNPSALELYLQQWPATKSGSLAADFQKALDATADLLGPAAGAVLDDPQIAPLPIATPEQSTTRPVPPPTTSGPEWYNLATAEIGKREIGNSNDGPEIRRYRQLGQCGAPGDPWCAVFVNAMFALCKTPTLPGTKSASSQSFCDNRNFAKLGGPARGAVVVFWRISPNSGKGHVGFYYGETANSVYVLGGNENNMVRIAPMKKGQLIGYWWPTTVTQPTIGEILVPPGSTNQRTQVT